MKGSWFLFAREETHPDDCRWRAKNWHTTKVKDRNSHRNYHLGFRCCADLERPRDHDVEDSLPRDHDAERSLPRDHDAER